MSDIQNLIKLLQSNNHNKRYDACELLRVSSSLPHEALDALRVAANDENPDVADAAQRALAFHDPQPKPDIVDEKENDKAVKSTLIYTKGSDFAIGFFGWFLIGSLVMGVGEFALLVVTVIAIGILFFTKKNWLAYGIVAAIITNTLIFMLIFSLMGGFDWESIKLSLIYSLSAPFFMVGGYY